MSGQEKDESLDRPFEPDWVSAPGETIAEVMEERDMHVHGLALRLQRSDDFVQRLLAGDELIDAKLAEDLSKVIGSTKEFWIAREENYRKGLVRLKRQGKA